MYFCLHRVTKPKTKTNLTGFFNTKKITPIMEGLKVLGVIPDYEANNCRGEEVLVTTPESAVPCYVVPTDEEIMIARDTYNLCNE